jgi:hypothetical protein
MSALTRGIAATFAKAVRHPLPWTAVGVLLAVLVLLPMNERSPIDSPVVEDVGMSALAPSMAKHVKLVAITTVNIGPLLRDATLATSRTAEPSSAPIHDRPPLLAVLRL